MKAIVRNRYGSVAIRIGSHPWGRLHLLWRFVIPIAAYLALLGVALLLVRGEEVALFWLASLSILLLVIAARNAWDLLVRAGELRRAR